MKNYKGITCFFLFFLILFDFALGITRPTIRSLREKEPLILTASLFPDYLGADVRTIHMFRYALSSKTWQPIPFQIDEKGWEISTNFYDSTKIDTIYNYFGALNGILDPEEEILFIMKDGGDRAPENAWITDTNSRLYPRYEIEITDPLDSLLTDYVYLFRSPTLTTDPGLSDYVQLNPASSDTTGDDEITGLSYVEGHDLKGFTTDWKVKLSQIDADMTDILDMLKMRLKVNFGFVIKLLEIDALQVRRLEYVDGRIRVIRRLNYFLEFLLATEPIGIADFITYYYPFNTDAKGPTKNLDPSWGISYLRQSFDLNENAIGMRFNNPYNTNVIIDGSPDDNVDRTLYQPPELNWHLISGEPGSILFSYVLPSLGELRELYYFDNSSETSGDGFSRDSGDGVAYGDVGIAITGDGLEGSFGMSYQALFLDANQDPSIGMAYVQTRQNPLKTTVSKAEYDFVPPAAVTDLTVTGFTKQTITLTWTAPGDDDTGGNPVSKYELRYSKLPAIEEELDEWWNLAQVAKAFLKPGNPGEQQEITVGGLQADMTYYFVLKSQDDMQQWSGYSNIAVGTAFPVELVAFHVRQQANDVLVEWHTASETNNHGFQVQRKSLNEPAASQIWKVLGFIPGQGTSVVPQRYRYIDDEVGTGRFLYRLKQIDRNGEFSYSSEQSIILEGPRCFKLMQNYPNPFNPETTIEFQVPSTGKKAEKMAPRITILNILGNEIRVFKFNNLRAGTHRVQWDGTDSRGRKVTAGIYFYRLNSESVVLTRKMLVLP